MNIINLYHIELVLSVNSRVKRFEEYGIEDSYTRLEHGHKTLADIEKKESLLTPFQA